MLPPKVEPIHITVEAVNGDQCPRCRRFIGAAHEDYPLCNLGICRRCTEVCIEGGWIEPVSQTKEDWANPALRGQFRFTARMTT